MDQLLRNLTVVFVCGFIYYTFEYVLESYSKFTDTINEVNTTMIPARRPRVNVNKRPIKGTKYILLRPASYNPFHLLNLGQDAFIYSNCKFKNCFITDDRYYFDDYKYFDAVLFSGVGIVGGKKIIWREQRSWEQKYVFAALESPSMHPISNPMYDNFFNWTWTYRLSSDVSWKYITIYDLNGTVIGPAKDIEWQKHYKPISGRIKRKLRQKSKPAAWFVTHCRTPGQRENFVNQLKIEFHKYGWSIDMYGECGQFRCYGTWCNKMLEKHYYFYFSFENSVDEDYVTEKVLTALNNLVVPVVYGGANYSRFLPPGSYLNARELGPKKLAKAMDEAIRNISIYYDFFRWKNHYRFESSDKTTELCNICTALNNKEMVKKTTTYKHFRRWWNGALRQRNYDVMLQVFLSSDSLLNLAANYNFTRLASWVLMQHIQSHFTLFKDQSTTTRNSTDMAISMAIGTDGSSRGVPFLNHLLKNYKNNIIYRTTTSVPIYDHNLSSTGNSTLVMVSNMTKYFVAKL